MSLDKRLALLLLLLYVVDWVVLLRGIRKISGFGLGRAEEYSRRQGRGFS